MSENPLDRELQAALSVQPSPQFLPRLRARIASARPPTAWWFQSFARSERAVFIEVALALVAIAAVVIVPGLMRGQARVPTRPRAVLPSTSMTSMAGLATNPHSFIPGSTFGFVIFESRRLNRGSRMPTDVTRASNPKPAVIISSVETEALRRVFESAPEGRIAMSAAAPAETAQDSAVEPDLQVPATEIAIPPITIEPLVDESGKPQSEPGGADPG